MTSLEADPVSATWLGDHRYDNRLPQQTAADLAGHADRLDGYLSALDAVDDLHLSATEQVDLESCAQPSPSQSSMRVSGAHQPGIQWSGIQVPPCTSSPATFAPHDERLASA
jgi:hypothetical protein